MTQLSTVGLRIADLDFTIHAPAMITDRVQQAWPTFVVPAGSGICINVVLHDEVRTRASQPAAVLSGGDFVLSDGGLLNLRVDSSWRMAELDLWMHPLDAGRQFLPTGLHNALAGLLASALLRSDGFLMHSSAVRLRDDVAVAFIGRSGAGKSTVAGMYPPESVLSDELVAVTLAANTWVAHATPLSGSLGLMPARRDARLSGCLVLEQAKGTSFLRLDTRQALRHVLGVVAVPGGDHAGEQRAFERASVLVTHLPVLKMRFALTPHDTRTLVENTFSQAMS